MGTRPALRAATAHSRRRARPEKPVQSIRKMNPGVTLRAEGVPLFMSDVSEQAAPQLSLRNTRPRGPSNP